MFVGLLSGRTERRRKKREKLERQREKELREKKTGGGRVKKQPSFTLPARGNPYRISNKYRNAHYRPVTGTWSAYKSWARVAPPGGDAYDTMGTPIVKPPRGGFYQLNEKITQNIDTEEVSYWVCEQRLRRVKYSTSYINF